MAYPPSPVIMAWCGKSKVKGLGISDLQSDVYVGLDITMQSLSQSY